MQLHPFSLSFKDISLEKEYKTYYDHENRFFNRIGIALSFMAWFVLNIYCYLYYPQKFLHLTITLVVFLYPIFVLIFVVTANPKYVKLYQPLTALANVFAGLMFIYISYFVLGNNILAICGIIAVILFAFFILRLRFVIALFTSLVYFIAYEYAMLLTTVHEESNVALLSVIACVIEIVCIVGSYSLEKSDRKMFCQNKIIIQERQAAESATRAKSEFLANMSHESRTPLNAIIGLTHLALQTDLTVQQQDFLVKIQSSSQTLLGVIDDILDFSKIEAGKMDIEVADFNLDEMLTNLANLFNMNVQQKGIELLYHYTKNVPQSLRGDSLRLGQILTNLISNAIKFTEKGEIVVKIELLLMNENEIKLQFSVSDTGIGISKEQQSKLFQPFSQVDASTTRKYGGTGLGLAICERLVKLMGGSIWLESESGEGSTFFFTAMFGYSQAIESKQTKLNLQNFEDIKALIIDDNPIALEIMKDMLESMQFAVMGVGSGEQGLAALKDQSNTFDLVFMDWEMSAMDRMEISRRIEAMDEINIKPKIIMISACILSEPDNEASQLGKYKRLTKPITKSQLVDAVIDVFGADRDKLSPDGHKCPILDQSMHSKEAKILLVEDNQINQQVAKEMLHHMGLHVDIASNGLQALEFLKETEYDVVLMDVQMPLMDGYETTRIIRSNPSWVNLPVVAMTAHSMSEDREKSFQAGMNDHVNKPINPDELSAVIAKYINASRWTTSDTAKLYYEEDNTEDIPWTNMPNIMFDEGLARVGGNRELYKKLLLQFSSSNSDTLDNIKTALSKGDSETASRLVHTVKGVAANIGASQLASVAAEFETELNHGYTTVNNGLLKKFVVSLTVITEEIRAFQEKFSIVPSSEIQNKVISYVDVDVDGVRPHLINMAVMLENGSIDSVKQLSVLESYLNNTKVEKHLKKLKKNLDVFDMDGALGNLKWIASDLEISL